jgi:UDP-N-acetylmuramoyl-L-alanyl-D-glutamate--2,6-diaminopimelate ligase
MKGFKNSKNMKKLIKKLLPVSILNFYHKFLAQLASFFYANPSDQLVVIGVTGTNGKSTTANLIARALEANGDKVGMTTTVNFKIADKEWLNDKKMTMLGRFQLQRLLSKMVSAGCKYAVIETSSEGVKQFRHSGINYDYVVFTNLTPEHIESHGSFENYKEAKGKLFAHLTEKKWKKIDGREIRKISVVNIDDEYSDYFLSFRAEKKLKFSVGKTDTGITTAEDVEVSLKGTSFRVGNVEFNLQLIGAFNSYNALPAIAIAMEEGMPMDKVKEKLEAVKVVPGRMEIIDEGQPFSVIVDYAPEPFSLAKCYETIAALRQNELGVKRIIHVLGSCGGGRDKARRPILGKMAGQFADIVIVTNEDPYDDDPMQIIEEVAAGAVEMGKVLDVNLFKILDRVEAINKAMAIAEPGDLVLLTGKGSEQAIAVENGHYLPWDEREVAREALRRAR